MTAPCPLEPLEDRIIAVELPRPDTTWSGLHLPDPSGPIRARVVAAGPGRVTDYGQLIPAPARPGDTVLLKEHGPTEVDVDGVTYLTCTPMLVLAVEVGIERDATDGDFNGFRATGGVCASLNPVIYTRVEEQEQ